MSEVGCLKDGHFQNLQVEGDKVIHGNTKHVGDMTVDGALTVGGHLKSSKTLQSSACANVAPTSISDGLALAVNTFYVSIAGDADMTIPAATASSAGDFINIFYSVAVANGKAHTYTTTTDTTFAPGSTCQRVGGGVASLATVAAAADNILTITGHSAGDGGLGTSVRLVNMTGATNGWAVEAITYGQGANSQTGTIAFT